MINVKKLKPSGVFTNYIYKTIPLAFDESLSYYETLCGLLSYLKDTVIPTVDNNADALIELQNYVEHYFDNLDVQEEINNKLDEMVEDGTFDEIINQTLFTELNDKINNTSNDLNDLENSLQNKMIFHFPYLANINGDCYIFENGEKTFIVDLGRSATTSNIINYLISKNLTKIDGVIITHYHGDHVGGGTSEGNITGFENFFNSEDLDFSDCEVYLPFTDNMGIYNNFVGSARYIPTIELNIKNFLTSKDISFHEINTNETIEINDQTILTFYNADNTTFNNYYDITELQDDVEVTVYNNFSTIFEIKVNDKYFLGTGDIEEKAEEVNVSKLHVPSITKIEHHGNNNITNIDYLEKIINSEYGIVLPTNTYYTNIYKPTTDAFNTTKKLIWLDELQDNFIIKLENNIVNFVSKSNTTLLPISYNNHIKSLNSPSVFTDFAVAKSLYENTDLNDITSPETYKSVTAGVGTYKNVPIENTSFRLFVTRILETDERLMQVYVTNNDYRIFIRKLTSNGWTSWNPIATNGMGQLIPNNSDLNDYVIAGKYYIGSANNSNTISNRPNGITSSPFVLEVDYMHDIRRLRQKLYNNVGEI